MSNSCNAATLPGLSDLSLNIGKLLGVDNVLNKVDNTNDNIDKVNTTANKIMDKAHDNWSKIKPYAIGTGALIGTLWITDILRNIKEIRK